MADHRFDTLTKAATTAPNRRRVLTGLGGAALASVGLLTARRDAEAGCRKRCRRRCENRGPKCQDRCEDRLCD